jgi:hypothetical protein
VAGSGSGTSGVPVIHRRPEDAPGMRVGVAELKVVAASSTGAPLRWFPRWPPVWLGACRGGEHRTGQRGSQGRLGSEHAGRGDALNRVEGAGCTAWRARHGRQGKGGGRRKPCPPWTLGSWGSGPRWAFAGGLGAGPAVWDAGLRPENLRDVERPREEAKGAAEDFGQMGRKW